jgi:hypothetical protein
MICLKGFSFPNAAALCRVGVSREVQRILPSEPRPQLGSPKSVYGGVAGPSPTDLRSPAGQRLVTSALPWPSRAGAWCAWRPSPGDFVLHQPLSVVPPSGRFELHQTLGSSLLIVSLSILSLDILHPWALLTQHRAPYEKAREKEQLSAPRDRDLGRSPNTSTL